MSDHIVSNPYIKESVRAILSEFYENGIPDDVELRDSEFAEGCARFLAMLTPRPTAGF